MTVEEYMEKYAETQATFNKALQALDAEYITANAIAALGDSVHTRNCAIKVHEVTVTSGGHQSIHGCSVPDVCYVGVLLTKKGTPYKATQYRHILQRDIVKVREALT